MSCQGSAIRECMSGVGGGGGAGGGNRSVGERLFPFLKMINAIKSLKI